MARPGWSVKDAAAVLGIDPRRVTQSLDPTLDRIARLWEADDVRTMIAIIATIERRRAERESAGVGRASSGISDDIPSL